MTIKDIAFSYIGKKEIPGNMGFEDNNFGWDILMKCFQLLSCRHGIILKKQITAH